ncbi:MAG: PQQ-binding-like beta-propeller repeat protein [Planctomycetaceae bacterium]
MSEPRDNLNWDALEKLAADGGEEELDEVEEIDDVEEVDAASAEDEESGDSRRGRGKKTLPPRADAPGGDAKGGEAGKGEDRKKSADGERTTVSSRMRETLRHSRTRPGQEDTLRSPLVLGLGGAAAILALVGATFYFMIGRQTTEEAFNEGKTLYEEGKYGNAVSSFTKFLNEHGHHDLAEEAILYRSRAEVDKLVRTEKNYGEGLAKLREFVDRHSDNEELFKSHTGYVTERAQQISLEAAEQAGRAKDPELLTVSSDAQTLFKVYATPELKPEEVVAKILGARRVSEAAILKFNVGNDATAGIAAALKKSDTMGAISTWRTLVGRYAELRKDAKILALLRQALDAERDQVSIEELGTAALTEDVASDVAPPASFLFTRRSSTDEVSGGRCVLAVAKDCLYGVDTITGAAVWRRVIGLESPFFPVIEPATGGAIVYHTGTGELQKVEVNTGKLQWRVPVADRASSAPLLANGRALLPTVGGFLYDINLGDGSVTRRVKFSQGISSPALTPDGTRIALAGRLEVFYVLNLATLECERVQYLGDGHADGAIQAPMLSEGPYLIVCENSSGNDRCQVRILDASQTSGELVEVDSAMIDGLVVDAPVIRGQDLFVPSTGERVSAFTVSATAGQKILTTGPVYSGEPTSRYPIFLSTGPERQVWLASRDVRKLQLTAGSLTADQNIAAVGFISQPLQYLDRRLFVGRRRAYTDAVTFTRMDRDTLTSDTQAILGAGIIGLNVKDGQGETLVFANEAGAMFRASTANWTGGGVQEEAGDRLPLHEELAEPLYATAIDKGAVAIAAGGPEPKLFVVNNVGRMDRSFALNAGPVADLGFLADRVLVPVQGKLKLVSVGSQGAVEDFVLPTDQISDAKWSYVAVANETDAVAVLEQGDVILVRYQTTPRQYLGEVTRISLGHSVLVRGDVGDGSIAIADSSGTVHLFDAASLAEPRQRKLPAPVVNDLYIAGGAIFAEVDGHQLHCLAIDGELGEKWKLPLGESSLAGRPLVTAAGLVMPLRDGRVLLVSPADGAVVKTISTGQTLSSGAFQAGSDVLLPTFDGGLLRLTEALP